MKGLALVFTLFCCAVLSTIAQNNAHNIPPKKSDSPSSAPKRPAEDFSGMYTFLKDGEFIQLTIEDDGDVSGFISRFGDQDSDKGAFLNQFFKTAKLQGNNLEFTTKVVHGI